MWKPITPRPMNATLADIRFSCRTGEGRWLVGSRTIAAVAASGMTLIYRVRGIPAFEHRGHVGRRGVAHDDARCARGAADVRREDHVREGGEFGIELRLALEDVEPRAGDALRLQRVGQ